MEILTGEVLEIENLLSFRGKVTQTEVPEISKAMGAEITKAGCKGVGNAITVTWGIEGNILDIEILIPLDKEMVAAGKYVFKKKLKLVNTLVAKHKGNPAKLQDTCNELN